MPESAFDFLQIAESRLRQEFPQEAKQGRVIYWPQVYQVLGRSYHFKKATTRQLLKALADSGQVELVNSCGIRIREAQPTA